MILGQCHYCRKPIYYLIHRVRGAHYKCKKAYDSGTKKIAKKIRHFCEFGKDLQKLEEEIQGIARSSYIRKININEQLIKGWESAVESLLRDGLPSILAEQNLNAVLDHFPYIRKEVHQNEGYRNLKHLPFLRDVIAGLYPSIQATDNDFHFNLLNSEKMVWVFESVEYYQEVARTEVEVDTFDSDSNRNSRSTIARQVDRTSLEMIDTGVMGLSTMHIYFAGHSRRFRIPYHRIAVLNRDRHRFLGFNLGYRVINLTQDGQQAIPQQFRMDETWFAYNLMLILARQ